MTEAEIQSSLEKVEAREADRIEAHLHEVLGDDAPISRVISTTTYYSNASPEELKTIPPITEVAGWEIFGSVFIGRDMLPVDGGRADSPDIEEENPVAHRDQILRAILAAYRAGQSSSQESLTPTSSTELSKTVAGIVHRFRDESVADLKYALALRIAEVEVEVEKIQKELDRRRTEAAAAKKPAVPSDLDGRFEGDSQTIWENRLRHLSTEDKSRVDRIEQTLFEKVPDGLLKRRLTCGPGWEIGREFLSVGQALKLTQGELEVEVLILRTAAARQKALANGRAS